MAVAAKPRPISAQDTGHQETAAAVVVVAAAVAAERPTAVTRTVERRRAT